LPLSNEQTVKDTKKLTISTNLNTYLLLFSSLTCKFIKTWPGFASCVPVFQVYVLPGPGKLHPAVWFHYDLSPITVKYTEKRKPLYSFVTTVSELCCILTQFSSF